MAGVWRSLRFRWSDTRVPLRPQPAQEVQSSDLGLFLASPSARAVARKGKARNGTVDLEVVRTGESVSCGLDRKEEQNDG